MLLIKIVQKSTEILQILFSCFKTIFIKCLVFSQPVWDYHQRNYTKMLKLFIILNIKPKSTQYQKSLIQKYTQHYFQQINPHYLIISIYFLLFHQPF